MVEVARSKYPLNPTLKWTDSEGRLTSEAFRIMRAIGNLINAITIEDGEVTANMISVVNLEAISATLGNVVIDGDLVVNGTLTTGKMALNAFSEVTIFNQGAPVGPSAAEIFSGVVPIDDATGDTGLLILMVGYQNLPNASAPNTGLWRLELRRNGVVIASSAQIFYDDNFGQPVMFLWADQTPGTNPEYSITTLLETGPGTFTISECRGVAWRFKR